MTDSAERTNTTKFKQLTLEERRTMDLGLQQGLGVRAIARNRPRMTLGWRTPLAVYSQWLLQLSQASGVNTAQ